jgi:pimeloyl-ACP methyl ester carboxylesterase
MKTLLPLWMLAGAGCAVSAEPPLRLTSFRGELLEEGALRDVVVDGRRYCLAEMGDGPPLVLLHGLGGSIYDWRHLLRPLAEDHRVIAVDFLGAGESDLPEGEDYSVAAQARRLRGLFDHLQLKRATLMGNSFGGGVALRFAQDWPDRVDRLVLLNSVCYAEHIPGYVHAARFPFAACIAEAVPVGKLTRALLGDENRILSILSDEEWELYAQEIQRPGRRRAMIETLRALVPPNTAEFEERLKTIRAPALLLWGVVDTSVPIELGRRLVRDLADARLYELDAGHVPNQERPTEVLRRVREFLEARDP